MAEPNPRDIARAKQTVVEQFPEMQETEALLVTQPVPGMADQNLYVLTFAQQVALPGGGSLNRLVRVTMKEDGSIVKITSSR